jgi:hypothetical protein
LLLTYLDESYTKDRFYIAAVGCPDEVAIPLSAQIEAAAGLNWCALQVLASCAWNTDISERPV